MAKISTVTDTTMYQIKRWLGLNENPEGDVRNKLGEAAKMLNWKVTKGGSLQVRPGTEKKRRFGEEQSGLWVHTPIQGMWYGLIGDAYRFVVATGGALYEIDMEHTYPKDPDDPEYDADHVGEWKVTQLNGTVHSSNHVEFFPYEGLLFIMDGESYQWWDGSSGFGNSGAYLPTVLIGCDAASGSGTASEQMNLLSDTRKIIYTIKSSDVSNNSVTLHFLEHPISVSEVMNEVTATAYSTEELSFTTEVVDDVTRYTAVTITPTGTIPVGTNTISVTYQMDSDFASEVDGMRFYEYFNGANDNRVFLYGDGTNVCCYSGLTKTGQPTAKYFPAMNQISVGEENTPITGLIRHFSRLICYKTDSTYSIAYDTLTLEDGNVVPGFYLTPVNRSLGNQATGQVRLVSNNPVSLFNGNAYVWRSSASYGNLTYDERQAVVISDRVEETIKAMVPDNVYCFDHDYEQELYICHSDTVLVYNYGENVWYCYSNLRVKSIVEIDHVLYFGMSDGTIRRFSRDYRYDYREQPVMAEASDNPFTYLPLGGWGDDPFGTFYVDEHGTEHSCYIINGFAYLTSAGDERVENGYYVAVDDGRDAIAAHWESGAMPFDRDWKRKYSVQLWFDILPESHSEFTVSALSDKRTSHPVKEVVAATFGFGSVNFSEFTFGMFRIAHTKRVKLKVKNYVFYRLILDSNSKNSTATIIGTDILVRYAGNAK